MSVNVLFDTFNQSGTSRVVTWFTTLGDVDANTLLYSPDQAI